MMGCGKSAIGSAVARMLQAPYCDTDSEIERAEGRAIPDIFESHGEARFRALETEMLTGLLGGAARIVSAGGGLFMSERNRNVISGNGVSIWISADPGILWDRVRRKSSRPLLLTSDPYGTLESLLREREPVYALADLSVEAEADISIADMASKTLRVLADSRRPVLERVEPDVP